MAHWIRTGSTSNSSARSFSLRDSALRIASVFLLILAARTGAHGLAVDTHTKSSAKPCTPVEVNFDDSTDVLGFDNFKSAIAQLLKEEKFEELDCLADSFRSSKARQSGGGWKLHTVYSGLDDPRVGHATDEDWRDHLGRLQRWVDAHPKSITARIALAKSYSGYAWFARGHDYSDGVSNSGWKLFGQHLAKDKEILNQASALETKCPEWYVEMMEVAQGEGWDLEQETALLQKAIAFEPSYYYYYRMHANYLLPKWHGEAGDVARFAEESANRVGGNDGDIVYAVIAESIICACDEPEFRRISWPRIKKGYTEQEKQYGVSLTNLNLLALMASKAQDSETADSAFKRIGDNWQKEAWITEAYFNQTKTWAEQFAAIDAQFRTIKEAADSNMHTPQGPQYKKDFDQKFAAILRPCVQNAGADREKFEFMVQVDKDGGAQNVWMPRQTAVSICLFQALMISHQKKETPLPPPPHPEYWLDLDLDPATLVVASK